MRRVLYTVGAVALGAALVAALSLATQSNPTPSAAEAAQTATQPNSLPRAMTIVGIGKTSVKPDMAETTLGVRANAPTVSEATSKVNSDMDKILKALKGAGIAERDTQTTGFNVNIDQDRDGKPTGYQVSNMVRVRVRDLDKIGPTIDAALAAGANQVYGIQFTLADPTASQTQARAAAVADAKARATELATEAGVTLGDIVQISNVVGGGPVFADAAMKGMGAASAMQSVAVQVGELEVSAQVQVIYALK